ncbi:aminotransferase class I and II [Myroides odoratimimus]|uniref:HipA family kinase n=1 Tax=Myroides odoratimimus TaxID=76832 RepID=UPI00257897B6|nr:HipA family kinase [Myroides odoratimimus]MDM1098181.1 aminotransferase class I and II [Myroides odoratimimus]MDM1328299.1 aminotransferase class I and II [Myroides odoratimimus]MDM1444903.1 aminotransferase class I and II [Myroides odoratimimus]MDM1514072.1 aminotransferase class I and II [Myroides odoratimimus]MDO5858510.1 aminotransferase class I and II [Myroides odoratimimus]
MENQLGLRTVTVTRYIMPLREGGSLPALADADDDFKYVLKFRGAGHGIKALIAELLGGLIAKRLGLNVPELVFAELDEAFGRTEADEEIQDLLQFSKGLNLGLHFLSGALTYDPSALEIESKLASQIVWLDAFITNVDRTFRNTNMLIWHKELWLIDHGASFYFHHSFTNWEKSALTPFPFIKDHVLLPVAKELDLVDKEFKALLQEEDLKYITDQIPTDWLEWEESDLTPEEIRTIYFSFLKNRLANSNLFVNEAKKHQNAGI